MLMMDTMAANDSSISTVSDWAAVCRPPLPPDYELDDYWMENIVLKDEKEAEDEFYSALGRFTNQKLNPPPPYVAARIAAAPRYNPSFSSLLAKSKNPHDFTFPTSNTAVQLQKKKRSMGKNNEKVVDSLGWMNHHSKRKRSGSAGHVCNFLSGSAAAPHKKSNQKKETDDVNVGVKNHKRKRYPTSNDSEYYDYIPGRESEVLAKKQRLILVFKKRTTIAAVSAPPNSVHQKQINDVPPLKSVSPSVISAAPCVPAANHVPVQPDHELITNLIAAKMGFCGSLMLVMTKALTRTDLIPGQNRLSIPHGQVLNDFLDCKEKASLEPDHRKQKSIACPTFEVKLLMLDQHLLQQPYNLEDDEITVHSINIANWKSNSVYVLKTTWKSIVQRYQLQEGTNVQLWAFRDGQSKLCFALLRN